MYDREELKQIEEQQRRWQETTLKKNLERLRLPQSPVRVYSPLDAPNDPYMDKLGFPGEYPYTRGTYAVPIFATVYGGETREVRPAAGIYQGYGTAEDTRDLWRAEGRRGANVAFDLPTQCGFDSDHPAAQGEVGRVGVAVDTLDDFETIYEAFDGTATLDRMASNFTINAPCNIILAMYFALAEKKGVSLAQLRGTPQNDILKEFAARGTYIFPPAPSMRMIRDSITFCHRHAPELNTISICGYHMREAGASEVQASGFTFSHAIAYIQLGVDAGLDVDEFIPRFTFLDFGAGTDFWREIARARANRRIWARVMRERFGARSPRSWIMRGGDSVFVGPSCYTRQRPLNNLIRGVVGGVMGYLGAGYGGGGMPWDEVVGLGHSLEAYQLSTDAGRIMRHEFNLGDVMDPLAGSFFVEALTDEVEGQIWDVIQRVDDIGGGVEAIKSGYTQREIARAAYEQQRQLETGERVVVGVNAFQEGIEIIPDRRPLYDPSRIETAEERQLQRLKRVKEQRSRAGVDAALKAIGRAARDEGENLVPHFIDAVKARATVGEICDVLRDVFGVYRPEAL